MRVLPGHFSEGVCPLPLHSLPHPPQGLIEPEGRKGLARVPRWGKAATQGTARSELLRGQSAHLSFVEDVLHFGVFLLRR